MKIVIAGAGEVGSHLAKMLSSENHELTLIDNDQNKLEVLANRNDLLSVYGNATSINDLKNAGVEKADLFIAVTPHESLNITACILATTLGAVKTVARIDSQEYMQEGNTDVFLRMGIDYLIYPEMLAANQIVEAIKTSWQRVNISFDNDKLILLGIKVRTGAEVLNKQFKTGFLDHARFRVVAVKRGSLTIIPQGNDELLDGDIVFFITTKENIEFTREQAGKIDRPIRNVMIMGGSRIGIKTAQFLPDKVHAKIIETDYDRCVKMTEILHDNLVIHGDGRDLELLKEEGLEDMDAFIAVTGDSETNILACLAAKRFGVIKTIAEIENMDYIPLAQSLDIGTIINKKLIAAGYIHQLTLNENVLNVKNLTSSDAQMIEFVVNENSKITKGNLRSLKIPSEVNFGGYIRNGEGFICSGDTILQPGDHVILFCFASAIRKIESFFN
jgi:trk system potassium uptake protein TrkA